MADKDFVVKNGLVVNTNLIFANGVSKLVGINTTSPDADLTVSGAANISGSVTFGDTLNVLKDISTSGNVAVGANVLLNASAIFVGNSTINSIQNSSIISVANSTTSSNLTSGDLKIGATVVNSSVVTVGANATINTTAVYIGNSIANVVANSTSVFVGNSTVNLFANSSTVTFNNSATVNSTSFTGTAANATLFNNQPASFYANADNLTSGTVSNSRLPVQVVNTSGNFTLSGNMTFTGANVTVSSNVNLTGSFVNVASAFLINSIGAYHTGTINAASYTVGANVVVNSFAISFVGNTTTSPSITLANTGALTIGNSSTTQTGAIISIANSAGSANISALGFSGNGYNLSVNASKIDTGTLPWTQAPTGTVNSTGSFTLSGNTTLAGTNTTISSNLNVTGTFINVASAFVANSTGAYHTGVINAASHTVGTSFTANSSLVNAAAINITGQVNAATLYTATSANIASAVQANSTGLWTTGTVNAASHTVGTTVVVNSSILKADGVTINSAGGFFGGYVNASGFSTTGNANAANFYSGANLSVNNASIAWVGNTTTSPSITLANTGAFTIGNSTTTQTTAVISVANSTGTTNVSAAGFFGNGSGITTINATNITTGTLSWSQMPAGVVNTSGSFTITGNTTFAGNTTFGGANTVFNGNVHVAGSFLNVASAFVINSTGAYHTGIVNAASHTVGANVVVNSTAISYVGNTTTSPTVTLANTGIFTIGNSSTTQTSALISVANSSGSANISPAGFFGNGYNLSITAGKIDAGTLSSARVSGAYTGITSVGTLGTLTVSGNTSFTNGLITATSNTIGANVVTITDANVNFNSGALFVDAVNNRIGIKNTSPDAELTVTGSANVSGDLRVLGNLIITGNTVSAGTTEYTGSLNPQANGGTLGNTTKRWILTAVNGEFSGNIAFGSVLSINTNSLVYTGNTTTLPTITLANTGSFTIGNGTTTQTTSQISVSNSSSNVTITPSGISGNGFNLTSLNATSITSGTLASARISGAYTGITSVGTLAGLTVTGNTNFDSGVLFVDGTNNRVGVNTSAPSVTLQIASNDAVIVPIGTTAQRPAGSNGMIRYNVNTDIFEGYSGGSWKQVSETNGGYYKGNNGAAGNTNNKANLFRINANTQSNNITILAGENAMAAGPLTVSPGYTLTIETGGRVVIV